MTEPDVASSDATNISCSIRKTSDGTFRINGRKWWSTGALDPRCKVQEFGLECFAWNSVPQVAIVLGKMVGKEYENRSRHRQHSMVIIPMNRANVTVKRNLKVFGFTDSPQGHGEVWLEDVVVR